MPGRQKDFLKFRIRHKKLIYENFHYSFLNEAINIHFSFLMEDKKEAETTFMRFEPSISLSLRANSKKIKDLNVHALENLIFNMGMVELISYWKVACPSEVIIKPFHLDPNQINFWKKLYWNGLGEFFYVNGIETSISDFMQIKSESKEELKPFAFHATEKIIVPIGGGKDSAVSLELLKDASLELLPFIINPREASLNTVKQAGLSDANLLLANRQIHPTLLKLNEQGYLNGHTPFSAMLAFSSLLQAYLSGSKYIALSNESSANEPSVAGSHVNHQYSKSFEFESDFRDYYKKYITKGIEYFSFLRPLSELQIACLFAKLESHHYSFRSCNVGSKKDEWCCNCPKCLFTYIMLAPFLPENELNKMIGENLIIKPSLQNSLKELRGLTKVKPFECVGTVDEVNLALYQAITNNAYARSQSTDLQDDTFDQIHFNIALKDWNREHFLPEFLEILLKARLGQC